jgi:quercetin dioxygenase-like cupin family protein
MEISRRSVAILLAALPAAAQKPDADGSLAKLEGTIYDVSAMPWHKNASGTSKAKPIFNGLTTRGQHLTMHATELAAGQQPHPAARQPHEEILIIVQGTLECTINGQTAKIGPGAVVYSAYNDLKDWKNVGDERAIYYVISLEEHR